MKKRDPKKLFPHDYFLRPVVHAVPHFIHPNHVTVFRMVLTPFILLLLFFEYWAVGIPLFIFAALTDALDGSMARIRKEITAWGTLYDPVADKLLIGSVVLLIAVQSIHPAIVLSIVLLELLIIAGGWARARKRGAEAANNWAKAKMVLQVIGIGFALLSLWFGVPLYNDIAEGVLIVAIAFALISLLTYSL